MDRAIDYRRVGYRNSRLLGLVLPRVMLAVSESTPHPELPFHDSAVSHVEHPIRGTK